uniref:Vitellogenin domain-containing protein n=1 Tax=Anopheles culicifacies TaxID=139723 RepID=A0A182LXY5_9DIPT
MSLFRKPKKPIQRRVFSGYDDEDEENHNAAGRDTGANSFNNGSDNGSDINRSVPMDTDPAPEGPAVAVVPPTGSEHRKRKEHRAETSSSKGSLKAIPSTKPSLLSFDDEEEGEVFQVKKSSHSKKVMKTLDKERRRKRHLEKSNGTQTTAQSGYGVDQGKSNASRKQQYHTSSSPPSVTGPYGHDNNDKIKREKCENSSSNIQTEIRTDDFVLVVKKSDPENMILNGRAALCAGRNDMSSEDETNEEDESDGRMHHHHRFAKPQDNFKMCLENGVIPDAAMIHAARKRRQKAREQGEFIPVEEPKEDKNKKRTVQEDGDGDGSDEDDDRIDMSAITGAKEREERREQFYAVQREDSDAEDSDVETKEWENQQIRKGVTGAQLVSAQQESVISQYLIGTNFSQTFQNKSALLMDDQRTGDVSNELRGLSTAALLEKAYAATSGIRLAGGGSKRTNASNSGSGGIAKTTDTKPTGPRMPQQILAQLTDRHRTTAELNRKHDDDIKQITQEIKLLGMDHLSCEQKAPVAAAKYRFYQEFRCYVSDLIECLNEKVPLVTALEQKALTLQGKHSGMLIERRRQDMRDQVKEVSDANKGIKRVGPEEQERVRRAAEREGRRTRRRRDREKNETAESHFDGMSSDDEIPDMEAARYRSALQAIELEAREVFVDAAEEYGEVAGILERFEQWRQHDMPAYSDAYVSLCLPKILAPLIRLEHVCWNPLTMDALVELENEKWYRTVAQYGCSATTEAALAADPDVRLIPTLVEKIFLPKLTALVEQYWDPLSTTQTFRLVRLLKRFVRDYPSLKITCKPLRVLFQAILDKLKQSIDNDVFIPIFPKQAQEAKSSFFQRQFCSGLKLLRNITSWQGILADAALKELAIGSLLNRYLLNGMRVCSPVDAIAKASTIVYTLPRVWLNSSTTVVQNMDQFVTMLQHLQSQLDPALPQNGNSVAGPRLLPGCKPYTYSAASESVAPLGRENTDVTTMLPLFSDRTNAFDIFPPNYDIRYRLETDVTLVPDVHATDNYMWYLNGYLRVHRYDARNLAAQIELDRHHIPQSEGDVSALLEPFRIAIGNDTILSIQFKLNEPIWSANIKRALASLLQAHGDGPGAYVVDEQGIFGSCPTEYFVVNKSNVFEISKTYGMDRCTIYRGAIYLTRSNIPQNHCIPNKQPQAITSRIANYKLRKIESYRYMLTELDGTMRTNIRTLESYYPQFLYSRVVLRYEQHQVLDGAPSRPVVDVVNGMALLFSPILFDSPDLEATGGRSPKSKEKLIKRTASLLNAMADNLETVDNKLKEPYDETVSEIIRLMGTMDLETLKQLYEEIDLGTSYRQETARNIFLEIVPRTGTTSTILLTRDLIMNKQVNPMTAVQLLISLPFYMAEPSQELVKECEVFLEVGADRPDIKHAAVLSYATMIYNTFVAGKLTADTFEKYVKMYFDLFLNSFEYEQQMLYLEGLGNLQLENVAEYLDPIIRADYPQNTDIRFLAMLALLPTAHLRPNQVYETYWPIFHSRTSPLQLRVAAFTMLLFSNPTPGRLLGLYSVIKTENDPHMINFYRTTVLSISETTYPCYQHLKLLLAYMTRQLPDAPAPKYWVTGNYLFDYRDRKFHIGSMLQTMLIGSHQTDLPMIASLKFDTEALGRFTGQLGLYIKARGLSDAVINRLTTFNSSHLRLDRLSSILKSMKLSTISPTPLHFEFIVQFEGKAVLCYHLNQTTFHNLTDGNIINRINLLRDSHVNMQIVRRPFMIKYALPTLLGTPADILIENTVLATVRGNTTQQMMLMDKVARSNQVDIRYSSYAVVKIRSYNPINDVEYSTIREQGFLVYIPVNNEIVWDIAGKSISYSFYRPENMTSGISLKSRTRNTPANGSTAAETLEPKEEDIAKYGYRIDDLGIQLLARVHQDYTKDNVMFMLETDILDNAKVLTKAPFSLVNNLLRIISLIQLNTIHIGRDKHLTLLIANDQKTLLQGTLKWDTQNYSKQPSVPENEVLRVNLILAHTIPKPEGSRDEVKVLHKWDIVSQYTNFKCDRAAQIFFSLTRHEWNSSHWKVC